MTVRAVEKFQVKYGLAQTGDSGYGLVGPKTRAKLAEVFGQPAQAGEAAVPTTAQAPSAEPSTSMTAPSGVSAVFSSGVGRGNSNADVKRLQQLLNSDPDTAIASSGTGSAGNETEYFGSLTEKAVQKFQVKYGVANVGDAGYGFVGPKTRAKLSEVFGSTAPAAPAETPAAPVAPTPITPTPAAPAPVPFWLQLTPVTPGGASVQPLPQQ